MPFGERMARRTFHVIDITEILAHWYAGRSQYDVAGSLRVDRKTIRRYVEAAIAAGFVPGGTPPMSREDWAPLVKQWFPHLTETRLRQVTWPEFAKHHGCIVEMLRAGVTKAPWAAGCAALGSTPDPPWKASTSAPTRNSRPRKSVTSPRCAGCKPENRSSSTARSGVGKTHVAQAMGHLAIRAGGEVRFHKTSRILADLADGHADRAFDKRLAAHVKADLLILDDFAMRSSPTARPTTSTS
jgi:hypothetical protein